MSEFEQVDACANCKIREFCSQYPEDKYTCEDVMTLAGILDYQAPELR